MDRIPTYRVCAWCGHEMAEDAPRQRKYCSHACRSAAWRSRSARRGTDAPIPVVTLGGMTDDTVAQALVDLGDLSALLLDASMCARPALQPMCWRVGMGVRELLENEGVVDR